MMVVVVIMMMNSMASGGARFAISQHLQDDTLEKPQLTTEKTGWLYDFSVTSDLWAPSLIRPALF